MLVPELVGFLRSDAVEVLVVVASFSLLVVGFDEEDGSERQTASSKIVSDMQMSRGIPSYRKHPIALAKLSAFA